MLRKGVITQVNTGKGKFLSNSFLAKKKEGGMGGEGEEQSPIINLKHLNAFLTCNHFKMEGLQNLIYFLQEGNYLCKLDLKDAYY